MRMSSSPQNALTFKSYPVLSPPRSPSIMQQYAPTSCRGRSSALILFGSLLARIIHESHSRAGFPEPLRVGRIEGHRQLRDEGTRRSIGESSIFPNGQELSRRSHLIPVVEKHGRNGKAEFAPAEYGAIASLLIHCTAPQLFHLGAALLLLQSFQPR